MVTKKLAVLILGVSLLAACSAEDQAAQPQNCYDNMPERIPGLKVAGARSEKNVIKNLWPVVCRAREMYRERLKDNPKLEGTIELKISVEFNGEIGPHGIARSTLADPVLERHVLRLLQSRDFDPYGSQNSESHILFPIHLIP